MNWNSTWISPVYGEFWSLMRSAEQRVTGTAGAEGSSYHVLLRCGLAPFPKAPIQTLEQNLKQAHAHLCPTSIARLHFFVLRRECSYCYLSWSIKLSSPALRSNFESRSRCFLFHFHACVPGWLHSHQQHHGRGARLGHAWSTFRKVEPSWPLDCPPALSHQYFMQK